MTDSPHQEPRTEGDLRSPSSEDTAPHLLHQFLNLHDEPCPACSYNLRGLTGHTCPECGEELRLRVGLVEPRLAHFIAGLLGLSTGLGFFAIIHIVLLMAVMQGAPIGVSDLLLVSTPALLLGAATWWWIKRRVWIRRRSPQLRAALLAGGWLLTAASVTLLFALVD